MTLKEQVFMGLKQHLRPSEDFIVGCSECPYHKEDKGNVTSYDNCRKNLYEDICTLINEMQDVIDLLEAKE